MGDQPVTVALPKAVELMWGLGEPGTRGPKRGLTLEQVVDAAAEVADAEGFAAVSMSRIAKQLGFTTMSLYRYVDSKDTLVDLLADRVIGPPPTIPVGASWRETLEAWAWGEFTAIRKRPWWLDIPMVAPPMGPNNMAWLETALSGFAATAVPEPIKLQLVLNLSLYVIGRLRLMREFSSNAENEDYGAILAQVLDPQRFPSVVAAMYQQAFDEDEVNWEEGDFRFGLDRLLDGYEKFVAQFQ